MNELNFEEAIKRLEEIVEKLESGNCPLEDSVKLYDEGIKLSSFCDKKLNEAKQKIISIDEYIKENNKDE